MLISFYVTLSTVNKETFSNEVWKLLLQWRSQDWKQKNWNSNFSAESRQTPLPSVRFLGKDSCIKAQVSFVIIIGDEMWGHHIWFKNIYLLLLLFSPT